MVTPYRHPQGGCMSHRAALPRFTPPESEYNPEQASVISAPSGIVFLQAGPGTGKSKTLLGRMIALACNERIEPERMLALVFNRAVQGHLAALLGRELGAHGEAIAVRTFGSFGLR